MLQTIQWLSAHFSEAFRNACSIFWSNFVISHRWGRVLDLPVLCPRLERTYSYGLTPAQALMCTKIYIDIDIYGEAQQFLRYYTTLHYNVAFMSFLTSVCFMGWIMRAIALLGLWKAVFYIVHQYISRYHYIRWLDGTHCFVFWFVSILVVGCFCRPCTKVVQYLRTCAGYSSKAHFSFATHGDNGIYNTFEPFINLVMRDVETLLCTKLKLS